MLVGHGVSVTIGVISAGVADSSPLTVAGIAVGLIAVSSTLGALADGMITGSVLVVEVSGVVAPLITDER